MFMLFGLSAVAMAESVEIALNSSTGFTGGNDGYSVTTQGFTISYQKASSTSSCRKPDSDHIRVYADAEFTIAGTEGIEISKIVLEGISGNVKDMKVGTTTYKWSSTNLTWTGSASSVTFSASAQSRIKSATITYTVVNNDKTVATLSFDQTDCKVNLGEEFTAPVLSVEPEEARAAVVYSSENEAVAKIVGGSIEIIGAGSTTITASIPSDNESYRATPVSYKLTVVDPNAISDEVTGDSFDGFTNKYQQYSYSSDYADYEMFGYKNSGIQWNTNSQSNSGIYVNAKTGYQIRSIKVESNYKKEITLYSNTSAYTDLSKVTDSDKVVNLSSNSSEYTFSTPVSYIALHPAATGAVVVTKITIDYTVAAVDPDGVSAPGIAFDPVTNMVTLSCETEDASVYYTIDGTDPSSESTLYNEPFEIAESCLLKAVAVKGGKSSDIVTKNLTVAPRVKNIKEILTLADEEEARIDFAMTVVAIQGLYCYVIDNQGGHGLIYKSDLSYEAGDIIPAGWMMKMSIFNGLHEIVPVASMPEASGKGEYDIEVYEAEYIDTVLENEVVKLEYVTFSEATPGSGAFTGKCGEVEINFYNSAKLASVEAGIYNVTFAGSVFNGKVQYIPLEYVAVPSHPVVYVDEEENTADEITVALDDKEKVVIVLNHADTDNHTVYHKFTEDAATVVALSADEADGFVPYTEAIEITKAGKLEYYARHNTTGAKSQTRTISFTGVTLGIAEISGEEASNVEWFDFQGRRIAAPAKGVYLRRQGGQVSKLAL